MSDCPFESDLLDALASQRWPARAGDELRQHVAACECCRDLAVTASALIAEHDAAHAGAGVPPAALVWHRAQLRARQEATRAAMRPIGFIQGVAFACAVALAIGTAVWAGPFLAASLPDMSAIMSWFRAPALSAPDVDLVALLSSTTVQVAIGGCLLLAPVALYAAIGTGRD
jgi:hypothetical protein